MAQRDGAPVASAAFVRDQLAQANEIFGPLGIELVLQARDALAPRHAELVTRADRDALARHFRPGTVHWFVVARLMDVDEPGRERQGVHWRARRARHRHFVIVSKIAGSYVLAHELGHYFGNPQHSQVPGNLMSYTRRAPPPFLDDEQVRRVRATLARLRETGELVPLAVP